MLHKQITNSLHPSWVDDFLETHYWNEIKNYSDKTTLPPVNILEKKDEFQIEVSAPGMEKKDFTINLENNVLSITSTKEDSLEEKKRKYLRKEFSYSHFKRSFTLPKSVKEEEIQASYKEGILFIQIPKKELSKIKPSRHISII